MNRPELNYRGGDWATLKMWLEQEQLDSYKRLADPACSVADTERFRGRLLLITQMLDFDQEIAAHPGR